MHHELLRLVIVDMKCFFCHTFQEHNLLVLMTHLSRLSWKKVMTCFLDRKCLADVWEVLVNHRQRVASNHAGLVSMLTSVVEEKQCINPCRHWTDGRIEADDLWIFASFMTGLQCLLKRRTVACKSVMITLWNDKWFQPRLMGAASALTSSYLRSLGSYKTIVKLSLFLAIHPPWRSFSRKNTANQNNSRCPHPTHLFASQANSLGL